MLGQARGADSNTVTVLESHSYTPYGVPFGAVGSSQIPYGFTGEPTDSNSLLYLRARYYNPAAGVFPSLDPFEGISDRPMSMNGYSWVEGNVPNAVDPSGQIADGGLVTIPAAVVVGVVAIGVIVVGGLLHRDL